MSTPSRQSPFRALLWKEWRESWWLLVATAMAPAAAHVAAHALGYYGDNRAVWPFLVAVFAFLAFTLGGRLFASEAARGSAVFQHERPVERKIIWNAKLLLPLGALLSSAALMVIAASLWVPPGGLMHPRFSTIDTSLFMFALGFIAFSSCTLSSGLLDRPITAFAAGAVLWTGLGLAHVFLFDHAGWDPVGRGPHPFLGLTIALCIESLLILLLSRFLYTRLP